MIQKLKTATDKEELKTLLNEFLDSEMDSKTLEYIRSREDLLLIMEEIKEETKGPSLKSVLAKIDDWNKEHNPELVPVDPTSLEERIELQKKFRK